MGNSIDLIFVDERRGEFVVRKEEATRALKKFDRREPAWNDAIDRARRHRDVIVERNQAGSPVRWMIMDTP